MEVSVREILRFLESVTNIASFKLVGDIHDRVSAIFHMICRDSKPISIVEDGGLQHLLKITFIMLL